MTADHQLSFPRKVGFTFGDFACNLYWQSVSIFLLFFYTEYVGLSASVAGLIYMIATIVDALCDPIMGSIADRTRTRWGRYRPYILFGGPPLALSFVFLYFRPPLAGLWLAIWMLASHIIFRLAYTALSIPYTSLNARLTSSSDERSTIAGLRMVFAVGAAMAVAFFTMPLAASFGAAKTGLGYMFAAGVFALVATVIFPIVVWQTREPPEAPDDTRGPGLVAAWKAIAGNRAFWVLIVASCTAFACSTALGKSVLYYFKYSLRDEASARLALTAMSAVGVAVIPLWVLITKRIGKRRAWFAATLWGLALLAVFGLVPIASAPLMIAWLMAMNASSLGLSFTFWSLLPDTVEYGEWRTGVRTESFIFGLGQLFLKAALGIGAGLFGVLLDLTGYHAGVAQSAHTLAGLHSIMVFTPLVGFSLAGLVMILFPMKHGTHESIVASLARDRAAAFEMTPADL